MMHDHGKSKEHRTWHEQELPTHEDRPRDGVPKIKYMQMTWHGMMHLINDFYCKQ